VDAIPGDDTREVAGRIALAHQEVRLIIRKGRQGVGTAVRAGIGAASGEAILILMGDAAERGTDVVTVARKMQEGYDIVVGNRFVKNHRIAGYPALKHCANRLCNLAVRLLFGIPTSDVTNAFKAYSSKAVRRLDLKSSGYSIFLELPMKAYLSGGQQLVEVPVSHTVIPKRHGLRILRDGIPYFAVVVGLILCRERSKR